MPAVYEGMTWETQRAGAPGRLSFRACDDAARLLSEGAAVRVTEDGAPLFAGFVFARELGEDRSVAVTAYDQLRYFKNRDSYLYEGKKASELTAMLAADFGLKTGVLEDTGWVIPSRLEDAAELFEMVKNALDETRTHTGREFVLYDDCGKLCLRSVENMRLPLLISAETAQGYNLRSSIDRGVCTRVKLVHENRRGGTRQVFLAEDKAHQSEWGVLQHFQKISEPLGAQQAAQTILRESGQKSMELSVRGVFGDRRVRAGCQLRVSLNIGEQTVDGWMTVEQAQHRWGREGHTMDLTLSGNGFGE